MVSLTWVSYYPYPRNKPRGRSGEGAAPYIDKPDVSIWLQGAVRLCPVRELKQIAVRLHAVNSKKSPQRPKIKFVKSSCCFLLLSRGFGKIQQSNHYFFNDPDSILLILWVLLTKTNLNNWSKLKLNRRNKQRYFKKIVDFSEKLSIIMIVKWRDRSDEGKTARVADTDHGLFWHWGSGVMGRWNAALTRKPF